MPRSPSGPAYPTVLYNSMISPIVRYAIRGVIWYQGESNRDRAYQCRTLFPALIKSWRRAWGQGNFPFLFVQLANFGRVRSKPGGSRWAELREAQAMALSVPKTGMAVAIDIGNAKNIHPKNKQEVAIRLVLNALHIAYGKNLAYSGPIYRSMRIEGSKIVLNFNHVDGGLSAKGGNRLKGFAIAGANEKFVWAHATIEGSSVVVSSKRVSRPVAIRYGWASDPLCNLYNKAGLPASPFRTDSWRVITQHGKKR